MIFRLLEKFLQKTAGVFTIFQITCNNSMVTWQLYFLQFNIFKNCLRGNKNFLSLTSKIMIQKKIINKNFKTFIH